MSINPKFTADEVIRRLCLGTLYPPDYLDAIYALTLELLEVRGQVMRESLMRLYEPPPAP